jgi:hypothetical protein
LVRRAAAAAACGGGAVNKGLSKSGVAVADAVRLFFIVGVVSAVGCLVVFGGSSAIHRFFAMLGLVR